MYDPLPASPKYDKKMLDAHLKFRSWYLGRCRFSGGGGRDLCLIMNVSTRGKHYKEKIMAYTLDTTVGEILKDTRAVEILERHAPGISKNPMIAFAKGMTLKSVVAMPQARQAGVTEDM